jgi:hypothetical protein
VVLSRLLVACRARMSIESWSMRVGWGVECKLRP